MSEKYVMIYFIAPPKILANRLSNLRVRPDLGEDVKEEILNSAIIVAPDSDFTEVCYATLIPESLLPAVRLKPQFVGKGLNEVKTNRPLVYARIAQKTVQLVDDAVVRMDMADATPTGATVLAQDEPLHTFAGYDPWTGEGIYG